MTKSRVKVLGLIVQSPIRTNPGLTLLNKLYRVNPGLVLIGL